MNEITNIVETNEFDIFDNITQEDESESKKVLKEEIDLQNLFLSHLKNTQDIDDENNLSIIIPTGIDILDSILGGGLVNGFVQIAGPTGSGKSALCARIIASAQKKWPGKFISVYCDSEETTTEERLAQLGVLNPKVKPRTGITVEKLFKIVEGLCTFKESQKLLNNIPSIIIWDSIANTQTEMGIDNEDPNSVTGLKARMISHLLPRAINMLKKYHITLLAINQFRDKIDMGIYKTPNDLKYLAGNKVLPGGQAIIYNSSQLLVFKNSGEVKGEYGFIGQKVECKAVKNKSFSPNIPIDLIFSFERGFSNFWSNFEMLKKCKRVEASAWSKLTIYPQKKFRQNEAIKIYKEDEEFRKCFDSEVQDVLKTEYIDKYSSVKIESIEID